MPQVRIANNEHIDSEHIEAYFPTKKSNGEEKTGMFMLYHLGISRLEF